MCSQGMGLPGLRRTAGGDDVGPNAGSHSFGDPLISGHSALTGASMGGGGNGCCSVPVL
jgi:hypothetical protein